MPSSRLDFFPEKDLIRWYRQVFSTNEGKEVLAHMLFDLGTFEQISDGAEDVTLKNYGIRLLEILSGDKPSKDNILRFVEGLIHQTIPANMEKD